MAPACPHCACCHGGGESAHAMLALLAADDLDAALQRGLLECATCPACEPGCNARLDETRDTRLRALAARSRYRNRTRRLAHIKAERDAARAPPAATASSLPALPAAAAEALARALAKAGGSNPR